VDLTTRDKQVGLPARADQTLTFQAL